MLADGSGAFVESAALEAAWRTLEACVGTELTQQQREAAWSSAYRAAEKTGRKKKLIPDEIQYLAGRGYHAALARWDQRLAEHRGRKQAVLYDAAYRAAMIVISTAGENASDAARASALTAAQYENRGELAISTMDLQHLVEGAVSDAVLAVMDSSEKAAAKQAAAEHSEAEAARARAFVSARDNARWAADDALARVEADCPGERARELARVAASAALQGVDAAGILTACDLATLVESESESAVGAWRIRTAPSRAASGVGRIFKRVSDTVSSSIATRAAQSRATEIGFAAAITTVDGKRSDDPKTRDDAVATATAAIEGARSEFEGVELDVRRAASNAADRALAYLRSAEEQARIAHENKWRGAYAAAAEAARSALPAVRVDCVNEEEETAARTVARSAVEVFDSQYSPKLSEDELAGIVDQALVAELRRWSEERTRQSSEEVREIEEAAHSSALAVLRRYDEVHAFKSMRDESREAALEAAQVACRRFVSADDEANVREHAEAGYSSALRRWRSEVQPARTKREREVFEAAYRAAWVMLDEEDRFALDDAVVESAERAAQDAARVTNQVGYRLPKLRIEELATQAQQAAARDWHGTANERLNEARKWDAKARTAEHQGRVVGAQQGAAVGSAEEAYRRYSQPKQDRRATARTASARRDCTFRGQAVPNYYHVLQIAVGASPEVIEAARRGRLKACHPDRGGSVEEAKLVNEACDFLLDGQLRAEYDAENGFEDYMSA